LNFFLPLAATRCKNTDSHFYFSSSRILQTCQKLFWRLRGV
jgi:hypothetical protein